MVSLFVFLYHLSFYERLPAWHRSPPFPSHWCKNTRSRHWWASTELHRCHERSLETKKAGWFWNSEWIMPLNRLSLWCNINKSPCKTVKILIKMHQSRYVRVFFSLSSLPDELWYHLMSAIMWFIGGYSCLTWILARMGVFPHKQLMTRFSQMDRYELYLVTQLRLKRADYSL